VGNGGGGGVGTVVVEVVAWKHSDFNLSVDCERGSNVQKSDTQSSRRTIRAVNRGDERRVCQCSFDSKTQVNEL